MSLTKKDTAKSVKTLLVLLQSCRDQQVTITLRNDTIVQGTIVGVDGNMNIELKDAIVRPDPFYITKCPNLDSALRLDTGATVAASKNGDGVGASRCMTHSSNKKDAHREMDTVQRQHQQQQVEETDTCLKTPGGDFIDNNGDDVELTSTANTTTTTPNTGEDTYTTIRAGGSGSDDDLDDDVNSNCEEESDDTSSEEQNVNDGNDAGAGQTTSGDYFIVKGPRIRHIDLPTDCDLVASAKCEIERIRGRHKQWSKSDIVHHD